MLQKGILSDWNDQKGFGFVRVNGKGADVFVHISAFGAHARRPQDGDLITYQLESGKERNPRASKVRIVGDNASAPLPRSGRGLAGVSFALLFSALLAALAYRGQISLTVVTIYAVACVITFIIYAADKFAAQAKAWRTRESTLHLFELLGGWPAGLLAQRILHHKSRKRSYQVSFWIIVVLNCLGLVYLMTVYGTPLEARYIRMISAWLHHARTY